MKQIFFPILLALCATVLEAQTQERYARVEISLIGKNIGDLAALGIETDHGKYVAGRSLTTELSESEVKLVQNAGFQTETLIPDMVKWHKEQAKNPSVELRSGNCFADENPVQTPENYTYGTMAGYHTYSQMLAVLDDMAAKFPNLITVKKPVSDTILTWEGRPIFYVKISDNPNVDEDEPQVLYTALHHAREPNSASQMLFFMWSLLENYATDFEIQALVNNEELYFVPCVNPDGYVYNETTNPDGYGYWRKNRRDNGGGSFGVDLNRNYGYFWGNDNIGSSPNPDAQTYRGPTPFSEPETRMMRDFCREHEFLFTLNYHTSGNLLIYPWAYSDSPADSALIKYAQLFTRENHYHYGTATQTVGYQVNGSSDDWMLAEKGIFSLTPEVGQTGFWPAFDEIDILNKDNYWQNKALALCALRYAEVTDLSNKYLAQSNSDFEFNIRRYGLQDGPITVTLKPISPEIISPAASQTFDLQLFESKNFSFPVALSPSLQTSTNLLFLLETDMGDYVRKDTLRKTFLANSSQVLLFSDDADNFSNWEGNFELTTESYVSAPTSFTDSPNDIYFPGMFAIYDLVNPVNIPADAQFAQLRFQAHWDIQPDYDYAQVRAFDFGANFNTPLCGVYTVSGSGYAGGQPENEPVYEGQQNDWVEEIIDLSDYIGQTIYLEFVFSADGFLELDGFYFDDIRIEYLDSTSSSKIVYSLDDFRLRQNQPNPASGETLIGWENKNGLKGEGNLLVFNALGEKMLEQRVNLSAENQVRLDTRAWPPGLYSYLLRTAEGQTQPVKMTIFH